MYIYNYRTNNDSCVGFIDKTLLLHSSFLSLSNNIRVCMVAHILRREAGEAFSFFFSLKFFSREEKTYEGNRVNLPSNHYKHVQSGDLE